MQKLIFILLILSSLFIRSALADCKEPWNIPIPLVKDFTFPARTIIKAAPIGQELAKHRMQLWGEGVVPTCEGASTASIAVNTALIPSAQSKVYETGIKGIGVKFCPALDQTDKTWCAPFNWTVPDGRQPFAPKFIDVVFVRTGRGVASGNIPMTFNVNWASGGASLLIRSQGNTELVNDIFFAGCESVGAAVNVQMGKQTIQNIKNGAVKEVPFNFDVRCEGLKPNTPVPVKIYFEGNYQADGLLKLSNLGRAGVASGVGISLVNDKGIKLPFDIARSIALDWDRETADGSVYRFSGRAKYALTGGEVKAGKGDATMNFVINYN
ncbi:hypothetical protein C4K14_4022 [Pseudomonas chlororaphis subsp. aureofaciens]|uniref:fimbrial protein n=1 Tax=Pseudomonas chlororaphis TaxID=587753 RepID=UPI000F56A987|nr:fimbrial protein [Pseudomonas chlororaphis]AZD86844.1 hypothetical protein C4K14_4022 [Pseudomonas chlororaphis subsp. aureofaciens]